MQSRFSEEITDEPKQIRLITALFGFASTTTFFLTFVTIAVLNPEFDFFSDYVSKLGSQGQPYASVWNALGFGLVGILLAIFGGLFGICRQDFILGICLLISGLGFAMAATPTDFDESRSSLSKIHYASICFALAGWCLGLARLMKRKPSVDFAETISRYAVIFAILPMICISGHVSTEPLGHRIVLLVVFVWVILISIELMKTDRKGKLDESHLTPCCPTGESR